MRDSRTLVIHLELSRLISSCCTYLRIQPSYPTIYDHLLLTPQLFPYINSHYITLSRCLPVNRYIPQYATA